MKLSEGNSKFPEFDIDAMAEAGAVYVYDEPHSPDEWSSDSWSNGGWSWDSSTSWDAYWRKKERTLPENATERFLDGEMSG